MIITEASFNSYANILNIVIITKDNNNANYIKVIWIFLCYLVQIE